MHLKFVKNQMKRLVSESNKGKWPERPKVSPNLLIPMVLPDGNGDFTPCPELLTEEELVVFLRIPEISNSQDYHNVIENLKRMHDLPRIHICGKLLFPKEAVKEWIRSKTTNGK
jgi:hypothetical protein